MRVRMRMRRCRIVVWGSLGIYLLGLGFVSGMAVERMRFDRQRQVIVGRLAERTDRVPAHLMALERTVNAKSAARTVAAP